jgi:hypothetical protein
VRAWAAPAMVAMKVVHPLLHAAWHPPQRPARRHRPLAKRQHHAPPVGLMTWTMTFRFDTQFD